MEIKTYIRPDFWDIKPYSSARDEFEGKASIFLDANENPYPNSVNRYPDPLQIELKKKIAQIKSVDFKSIFLGNGSDECIDLLVKLTCVPFQDKVVAIAPSYGMYQVAATLNAVKLQEVRLNKDFSLNEEALLEAAKDAKLLFICSPNNPTGNTFPLTQLEKILQLSNCPVVIDEAYIDFAEEKSALTLIEKYSNLLVIQTFSKAYGMAGVRLGLLFAQNEWISWLNKVKPPYNINQLSQDFVSTRLNQLEEIKSQIAELKNERKKVSEQLKSFEFVKKVFPSQANFILIRVVDANELYKYLILHEIVVRNRSSQVMCENTLRISIGTPLENEKLIKVLQNYNNNKA